MNFTEYNIEDDSTIKTKSHEAKKEKTRSITYRLPVKLIEDLETEAMQKGMSHNVLAKQILEKYIRWDKFSNKIGLIPIPKEIITSFGIGLEIQDINMVVDILKQIIKDNVMFVKGKYDLKQCMEALEDYVRASGMNSDHRIEGSLHHFIIQHELGINWSTLTEQLLKEIFHEFLPEQIIKTQKTESTVIITISLGEDFDEHEY